MVVRQNISLTAKLCVTMPASEMASVVVPIKCPSVCATEDQLITGSTPRLDLLSIMPLTVQKVLVNTVGKINQELATVAADKASRMPHAMGTKLGSNHCHTSHRNRPTTSSTGGSLTTEVDNMTDIKCDIIAGGHKGIVARLVLWVQMRTMLTGDVLPWKLQTQLPLPIMLSV